MNKIKRIRNFYVPWLKRETVGARQVAWDGKYNQYLRFETLIRGVDLAGKTLLDIGCGVGDLFDYLRKREVEVDYTGVDILKEMVAIAKKRYPEGNFLKLDIFKDKNSFERQFDVVYASGTFNLNIGNNRKFIDEAIEVFWRISKRHFVFNLLHERSEKRDKEYHYTTPDEIIPSFKSYQCDLQIIDNYLQNDFTIVCTKLE